MGLRGDYFGDRGDVIKRDYGRFNVTNDEYDRFRLKVPTLRNIAQTFPYLHDSTAETLEEAVDIMAKYQTGKTITKEENQLLVAFMNSLTGTYEKGAASPTLLKKAVKFVESFSPAVEAKRLEVMTIRREGRKAFPPFCIFSKWRKKLQECKGCKPRGASGR